MNKNAEAITLFCSHLCKSDDIKPLEPREWSELAERLISKELQPGDLLDLDMNDMMRELSCTSDEAARLMRLTDRSGSMRFEISKYEDMGIQIVTRADAGYPKQLKKKLGGTCPPLFYCAGDIDLLSKPTAGYVGSREVELQDIEFAKKTVAKTAAKGYALVSGGAKGIDSISASAALSEGTDVIEYLSDSMLRKMRDSALVREIAAGHVLLMSVAIPTAGFNVGVAMMRNRYIYAQSNGTVVVRSEKGKGGTWAGASDNLKKGWCPTFCRDCDHPGNRELIRMGAIPITDDWDGDIEAAEARKTAPIGEEPEPKQLSIFDM